MLSPEAESGGHTVQHAALRSGPAFSTAYQDAVDYSDAEPDLESVIQIIEHQDAPAQIDAEVAALEGELRWTDHTEQTLRGPRQHSSSSSEQQQVTSAVEAAPAGEASEECIPDDRVFLLRFGSSSAGGDGPEQFRQ